jgi:cbb3-type cytochrome oxidase subunit 3
MRRLPIPLLRHNKAVSYAISAVIITAVTVTLVMVVSMYAYQVLEQQRGAAEFDVAKKSILAFDDALQDAAWKLNASRAVRFKVQYGSLQLIPSGMNLSVTATIGDTTVPLLNPTLTGLIRYSTSTRYITFAENYNETILGGKELIVNSSTESLGRALIKQESNFVSITLSYRTRAMRTSYLYVNETWVNYVSVWLIKVVTEYPTTHIHDFDLKARCIDIETNTSDPYNVTSGGYCTITVESEGESSSAQVGLDAGKVVFSVIVAEVKVSV